MGNCATKATLNSSFQIVIIVYKPELESSSTG